MVQYEEMENYSRTWRGEFRGAGWEVIKVIWGGLWDSLLEKDTLENLN